MAKLIANMHVNEKIRSHFYDSQGGTNETITYVVRNGPSGNLRKNAGRLLAEHRLIHRPTHMQRGIYAAETLCIKI